MSTPDLSNILNPPAWMAEGLCAQVDPDLFYPDKGGSTRQAKQVCLACPARAKCLAYALAHDERFGVWGATSERARRALARHAQPTTPEAGPGLRERAARIRRLSGAGLSDRQVADRVGCTTRTVQRIRARFAIPASRVPGDTRGVA